MASDVVSSPTIVTMSEVKARYYEVLDRAHAGEAFVVTKWGKPHARIVAANVNANDSDQSVSSSTSI